MLLNFLLGYVAKAMKQPDHMYSAIAITVCKIIQKLIAKIDFWYQKDLLGIYVNVCLVPKIHLLVHILRITLDTVTVVTKVTWYI